MLACDLKACFEFSNIYFHSDCVDAQSCFLCVKDTHNSVVCRCNVTHVRMLLHFIKFTVISDSLIFAQA